MVASICSSKMEQDSLSFVVLATDLFCLPNIIKFLKHPGLAGAFLFLLCSQNVS